MRKLQIANYKLQIENCRSAAWIGLFVCLMVGQSAGEPFSVIVCGSGGEPEYSVRFVEWGQRLQRVLVERCDHPGANVQLLTETGDGADGVSSVEGIGRALRAIGSRVSDRDDVFVFLIGHGSYRRGVAKLNVPGADLTAEELDGLLARLANRRTVVVNAASVSAAFINVLSGKGRVVCTSTRSAEERNATRLMSFFIQALEDGSADQDRDERISVLEACQQASTMTQAWYTSEGFLATEHALLDDNGDGRGTRLDEWTNTDGALASQIYLQDFKVPPGASPEVVAAYRVAIDQVQVLIQQKAEMDSASYYRELENRLLKAARLNRQIRSPD